MTDTPGEQLAEEPQEARGAPGSRDEGSDEPAAGPADRPVGTSDAESATSVDPQDPDEDDAPMLPSGGG